jgi:hypothetical protein
MGKTFISFENGGLCSTVISMISDSIFTNNHGCEGRGHTYYGKYLIKSDTIFFKKGITEPGIKIVCIDSEITTDNALELCFVDQHGANLSKKFRATFKRSNDLTYSLSYDSLKEVLFYPKISDEEVSLYTLQMLGIKTSSIKVDMSRGMIYTYHLNLPDYINQLNLFNKDILHEGTIDTMLIEPGKLIQYVSESPSFYIIPNEGKIVYVEKK